MAISFHTQSQSVKTLKIKRWIHTCSVGVHYEGWEGWVDFVFTFLCIEISQIIVYGKKTESVRIHFTFIIYFTFFNEVEKQRETETNDRTQKKKLGKDCESCVFTPDVSYK